MSKCIFCKIIKKELAADIIYEDNKAIAFKDISPQAPIHFLIIPKKHIPSVDHLNFRDKTLMGELILVAQKIARKKKLKGYKFVLTHLRDSYWV